MKFNEFFNYAVLKGLVHEPKFIDVSPFGVQYRLKINHPLVLNGYIYYREINNNQIMVSNAVSMACSMDGRQFDLTSEELLDMLS